MKYLDLLFFCLVLIGGIQSEIEYLSARVDQNSTSPEKLVRFVEHESIPTYTAHRIIYFTMDKHSYLAVANSNANTGVGPGNREISSIIYQWNGNVWVTYQEITTIGAIGLEFFTINGDHFLAIAQTFNGSTSLLKSPLYKWHKKSKKFRLFQQFDTQGAYQWTHFSMGANDYLAIANFCQNAPSVVKHEPKGVTTTEQYCPQFNTISEIYIWDKGERKFTNFQKISTYGATDFEFFSIGNEYFLAIANFSKNQNQACVESPIYKWNGLRFETYQEIKTCGATSWAFFTIGGTHYMAVANWANESSTNINSIIYSWNGREFTTYQEIPTVGGHYWLPFTIGDDHYLQLANYNSNNFGVNNLDVNSGIYIWENGKFKPFQWIPTSGALPGSFFQLDGDYYLVITNFGSTFGSGINGVVNSKIYRAVLATEPFINPDT